MSRVNSSKSRFGMRSWLGIGLIGLLLAECAAPPTAEAPAVPAAPLVPGMARVWFLRPPDPPNQNAYAASPLVYVDRQPLAQITPSTVFYHDFAPGRYRLSAQAFGTYAGQHDILHLDAGNEDYVQILGVANWELGSSVGGWSFAVLPMTPPAAKQYLPTMTDLGQG
jgi:hypothetical protein